MTIVVLGDPGEVQDLPEVASFQVDEVKLHFPAAKTELAYPS